MYRMFHTKHSAVTISPVTAVTDTLPVIRDNDQLIIIDEADRSARLSGALMQHLPTQIENQALRRVYDEPTETWWFSVVDIVQVLTQPPDPTTARKYWNKLKQRLGK